MIVEKYYPDETGKVVIDGIILKIRRNIKYKNYCKASEDIKRVKSIVSLGGICLFLGIFVLLGSVGHIELYSLKEIPDTWEMSTYYILDSIGTVILILGFIIVKWGWSKQTIYEKWIDEYLGQYKADKEAVG